MNFPGIEEPSRLNETKRKNKIKETEPYSNSTRATNKLSVYGSEKICEFLKSVVW